jgi:beta-lactamase superfamily II metal-dependent hydrolase
MRLTVLRAGQGDCLLLEGATKGRILVDAGVPDAYREFIRPLMGQLRDDGKDLDVVYVSHIDEDHIGGVLEMLNDEMLWRVHEFKLTSRQKTKVPDRPRPARIKKIWHNAFKEQLGDHLDPIEDTLAAMAPILSGTDSPALRKVAEAINGLGTSVPQAIAVSRRIGPKQLNIPLNPDSNGKLMMRRNGQAPITVGSMKLTILSPSGPDLEKLREDWKKWLDGHAPQLSKIKTKAAADETSIGNSDVAAFLAEMALTAQTFGDPSEVTPPNLASLMFFVKEGDQTILLTGDGRGDQVLAGLRATNLMPAAGPLHVDVLKVMHHGAENNIDPEFCDNVIADHYVFCGNGVSGNPDPKVLQLIVDHRLAGADTDAFKFWFNSSEAAADRPPQKTFMKNIEAKVAELQAASHGRLKAKFLTSGTGLKVL